MVQLYQNRREMSRDTLRFFHTIKGGTLIEVLQVILRKTLLKKGSSSNSFPKTFSIKFSPDRALPVLLLIFTSCVERPVGAKFSYKVFGKRGLGGKEPFLRKVFSSNNYI